MSLVLKLPVIQFLEYIVTCIPIARKQLGKHVLAVNTTQH
jgi:hypothetical protein